MKNRKFLSIILAFIVAVASFPVMAHAGGDSYTLCPDAIFVDLDARDVIYDECPANDLFDMLSKYIFENNQYQINAIKQQLEALGHVQLSDQEVIDFILETYAQEE